MKKRLSAEHLAELGYMLSANEMPNGQIRFRLLLPSGVEVRVGAEFPKGVSSSWEEAHFHTGQAEVLIVHDGKVAIARINRDGTKEVGLYDKGDIVTILPMVVHNVYPFPGSFMSAIKQGEPVGNPAKNGADWYPAPAFQVWTHELTEDDILRLAAE